MDSNPINEGAYSGRIEATEDVEGHGRFNVLDGADTDDVEGHRVSRVADEGDDVEGHMPFRKVDGGDVEAHGVRVRFTESPEPTGEDDDTEGHAIRSGR